MGLLTSYGLANAVVEEELCVTYSHRRISGSWSWTAANLSGSYGYMTEYHRYARKSFRYVGMDHDTAVACADEMTKKFTRIVRESTWDADIRNGGWNVQSVSEVLMADVSCTHVAGGMWEVSVRVNEDDVRYTKVGALPPSWNYEDIRDYSVESAADAAGGTGA